jgi:hypothetical protein
MTSLELEDKSGVRRQRELPSDLGNEATCLSS